MNFVCKNIFFFTFFTVLLTVGHVYGNEYNRHKINKNKDIVWNETIDFLVLNGFKIKTIDYNSGLIYSEKNIGGKNLGWDIKDKRLVSNEYLTCEKPPLHFVDTWVKGKVKFTLLNSDGYFTILIKKADPSTEIILFVGGSSQWGPVTGSENPIMSSCESNNSFEEYYISYLNGDKNIIFRENTFDDSYLNDSDLIESLDSGDTNQIRSAARSIFIAGGVSNAEIYEKLDKILMDNYKNPDNDSTLIDTLAWICKALATSSDPKYKVTLKEVSENADDHKVRKHAKSQ